MKISEILGLIQFAWMIFAFLQLLSVIRIIVYTIIAGGQPGVIPLNFRTGPIRNDHVDPDLVLLLAFSIGE
jgi:hypothetical protein